MEKAWEMAAAALCEGDGVKPCGVCRHCRKVRGRIHPDVTLVERLTDAKGKQAREIKVDQIRALGADASVRPNEAAGKVYIFPEAGTMNTQAQNAFLKLLEEPPAYVTFLLCTESRGLLLETVRSRCAEKRVGGETAAFDAQTQARADGFLDALHDRAELWRCCVNMEKLDGVQLTQVLECIRGKAVRGLSDPAELIALDAFLSRGIQYLKANIGVKHVTGYLATYLYDRK